MLPLKLSIRRRSSESSLFTRRREKKKKERRRREMAEEQRKKPCRFWIWALSSVFFRLILISFPGNLNLSSRPEVSTPLTSIRRRIASLSLTTSFSLKYLEFSSHFFVFCVKFSVAEGYWLKQASMSPYAGLSIFLLLSDLILCVFGF